MGVTRSRVIVRSHSAHVWLAVIVLILALSTFVLSLSFQRMRTHGYALSWDLPWDSRREETLFAETGLKKETSRGNWKYENGRLTLLSRNTILVTAPPSDDYLLDVSLEANGNLDAAPAILLHYQDEENYYTLQLEVNGRLELSKVLEGEQLRSLAWAESRVSSGKSHRFGIRVEDERLMVNVDGEPMIDYRDTDPLLGDGLAFASHSTPVSWFDLQVVPIDP